MSTNLQSFTTKSFTRINVTIANGQTESTPIQINGATAVGMFVPTGMTSTLMTFLVSDDDVSYAQLRDEENDPVTQTIGTSSGAYILRPTAFFAWNWLKIVVNQPESGDKTIGIMPGII